MQRSNTASKAIQKRIATRERFLMQTGVYKELVKQSPPDHVFKIDKYDLIAYQDILDNMDSLERDIAILRHTLGQHTADVQTTQDACTDSCGELASLQSEYTQLMDSLSEQINPTLMVKPEKTSELLQLITDLKHINASLQKQVPIFSRPAFFQQGTAPILGIRTSLERPPAAAQAQSASCPMPNRLFSTLTNAPTEERRHFGTLDFSPGENDYCVAIKIGDLDHSEYVLLVLGYFKQCGLQSDLIQEIEKHYIDAQYADAIEVIKTVCNEAVDLLGRSQSQLILEKAPHLCDVTRSKNYARRYFENKLAAFYFKEEIADERITRIFDFFIQLNPNFLFAKIEKHEDVSEKMTAFLNARQFQREIYDKHHLFTSSPLYLSKDACARAIFVEEKKDEVTRLIHYSQNTGVMTSMQPNCVDELSETPLINRVIDRRVLNFAGFSTTHPQYTSVSSVSGHAYFIVAILEYYMQAVTQGDPSVYQEHRLNLQEDINHFIQSFICSSIEHGYHGYHEMVVVFQSPEVQPVFEKYGVQCKIAWSDRIISQAIHATHAYTKKLCLERIVHEEMRRNSVR